MMQPKYSLISPDHAILKEDFITDSGKRIPAGYAWDGATLHRFAGIPKFGELVDIASLEHDWDYTHEGVFDDHPTITRKQADALLCSNLIKCGIDPLRAELAYRLCRAFGWVLWTKR